MLMGHLRSMWATDWATRGVAQLSEGLSRDVAPSEKTTDRNDKSPAIAGLPLMRRRGLEPPSGHPGPGPQPGASTNSAIGAREGEYSPGLRGLSPSATPCTLYEHTFES